MKAFFHLASLFQLLFVVVAAAENKSSDEGCLEFSVDFFLSTSVRRMTSALCSGIEFHIRLSKAFSKYGIGFSWLNLRNVNETALVELLVSFPKLGMLVDLSCPGSMDLLRTVDRRNLFTFSQSPTVWLVLTQGKLAEKEIRRLADGYQPELFNPVDFLMEPYEKDEKENLLLEINKKENEGFFNKDAGEEKLETQKKEENEREFGSEEMSQLFRMKILYDSQVALAVPLLESNSTRTLFDLYSIYKATAESKPTLFRMGHVERIFGNRCKLASRPFTEKRDFEGAILRGGSALFQPEAFTTFHDLSTKEVDVWSKMSYVHIKQLQEDLNFRVATRFFSGYGYEVNGSFGHLMGSLQKKKSDFCATAIMMRNDRFSVVDFITCPFRLQVGLIFMEPPLSSVRNIFLLPFSRGIWISTGAVMMLTLVAFHLRDFFKKPQEHQIITRPQLSEFSESFIYIFGVICQQGYWATPRHLADRITLLFLLLISWILFASYSASVVTLLQSSSSAISTISDMTKSSFEVGIEAKFPFFDILMKEASYPSIKEYYRRKIHDKRGKIYFDQREGIEKIRRGLFAYEVELNAGYKLISETFRDREKCGIKVIDLAPKPYICTCISKLSPFKEIFAQRLMRQEESGLIDRTWKLWVDQKPKCQVNRIGFISVGLVEFQPVLWIPVYGFFLSVSVLVLELGFKRKWKIRKVFPFFKNNLSKS